MLDDKEREERKARYQSLSPLQKFVKNQIFDAFILSIIAVNCVTLAYVTPGSDESIVVRVLEVIFNAIYIAEVVIRIAAFGILQYLSDPIRYVDLVVSAVSVIEIVFLIITAIAHALNQASPVSGGGVIKIISILRVLRAMRPLKSLSFIPFVADYISAIIVSMRDVVINVIFLAFAISCLAILFNGIIDDRLAYRCVPTDFTSTNVLQNQYYQEFGLSYFTSSYNTEVCGYKTCDEGFSCQLVGKFEGILGDYSTIWFSWITTLSFVTLRGWPHIFWAIDDAKGPYISLLVLILTPIITTFLIVNLFAAIFIVSLKAGAQKKYLRFIIELYPGDKQQLTELGLFAWANRKQRDIILRERKMKKQSNARLMKMMPWLSPVTKEKPITTGKQNAQSSTAVSYSALGDDSDDEMVDDALQEDEYEVNILVPNCLGCRSLRDMFANDSSKFAMFVMFIVVLNIFVLAIDSSNAYPETIAIIFYCNIVFNAIFGLECALKLLVSGPVRYFCSPLNDLDFVLTLLGLLTVGGLPLPSFLNNFRILRLLRLIRIYRLLALVDADKALTSTDPSINLDKLAFIMSYIGMPLLSVIVLLLLLMYMYSVLGMNLFYGWNYYDMSINQITEFNSTAIASYGDNGDVLSSSDLKYLWWGENLPRMNFGNFATTFLTMFNVLAFNSWYDVMINTMQVSDSNISPWFFIVFMLLSNYFLIATLVASISNAMERFAQETVSTNAKVARRLTLRIKQIQEKVIKKRYFLVFKKNTILDEMKEDQQTETGGIRRYVAVNDAKEDDIRPSFWIQFIKNRRFHSFYIFGRKNPIRIFLRWLTHTYLYAIFVMLAILASVVSVVSDDSEEVMSKENWETLNFYVVFVYYAEMIIQMIVRCVYGVRGAYFTFPMYWLDFAVNVVLLLDYGSLGVGLTAIRLARLAKLPQFFLILSNSESMRLVLASYRQSVKSLFTITSLLLITIGFFGVVGLQIWNGHLGYCSYEGYPSGQNRYHADSSFPSGCSGTVNTSPYGLSDVTESVQLSWRTKLDNFNDIFKSSKSVFKIFLSNNYGNILYSTIDDAGLDINPSENISPASFLFFLIIYFFALALGAMFTATNYYHFIIARVMGKKVLVGENAALWAAFRARLTFVQPKRTRGITFNERSKLKMFFHRLFKQPVYRLLISVFCIAPIILLVSFRPSTYDQTWFIPIDFGLSVGYIVEYMIRQYVHNFEFFQSSTAKYELPVFLYLCFEIAVCFAVFSGLPANTFVRVVVDFAVIVRTYRIAHAFNRFYTLLQTVTSSVGGFVPSVIYLIFVLIIYGEVGYLSFRDSDIDFQNSFLNEHYHFKDVKHACITIAAMTTGNMWTEVVNQLKNGNSFGWKVWVEFYFTSLYLIVFFFLRAFSIIVITKYTINGGGAIGLAGQQIKSFQRCWLNTGAQSLSPSQLALFLMRLPPPLGCGDSSDFLSALRFTKEVLLCMPLSVKDDSRDLFQEEDLPDDIRNWKDGEKHSFTFGEVLIAVHKRCMMGVMMLDKDAYYTRRELHRSRLALLMLRVGRMILTRDEVLTGRKADNIVTVTRNMLLLQRLDPSRFKELFIHILSGHLLAVKKNVQSFGFSGYDSFVISCLSKACRNQYRAAALQLKLRKALNPPFLASESASKAQEVAKIFEANVRRINDVARDLSDKYVGKLWNVHDMEPLARFKEKATVSAMAIDSYNTIFAGFSSGLLKIWRCTTGQGDVTKESHYKIAQTIELEKWIRSMYVSNDGLLLLVGAGSETVMLTTKATRKRRAQYNERNRFLDHSGDVTGVVSYGRYIVTCSEDGYIYIYSLATQQIVNSYTYLGAKFFCMQLVNLVDSSTPLEEFYCTDVVVCGGSDGYLTVIPLPLLSNNDVVSETQSIEAISLYGNSCPVSSVRSNWHYLYAGFADGTVKIWSMSIKKNAGSARYPVRMLNFIKVGMVGVHAGPVTSLAAAGGHLFSSSHDCSIVPWQAPEKMHAKTEAEYSQVQESGIVFHTNAIVCMTSNKNAIVSGDDSGNVVLMIPKGYDDQFADETSTANNKVSFSFLEYDFKSCFLPINGLASEEECYLNITNVSLKKVTVRCLFKRSNGFSVEMDPVINMKSGAVQVSRRNEAGRVIDLFEFDPNRSCQFRIIFSPESEGMFSSDVEFLINEKHLVKVPIRGVGIKNRVVVDERQRLLDFESVAVNETESRILHITNTSPRGVVLCLYDEDVTDSEGNKINLELKKITVEPKAFLVKDTESVDILVRYSPEEDMSSFEIPLRFSCAGAVCTLTTLRGRSHTGHSSGSSKRIDFDSSHVSMSFYVKDQQIVSRGLRELSFSEALCPGDLTNSMLNQNGYRILIDSHSSTIFHVNSGSFLEFINPNDTDKLWGHANVVDTLRLTFRCQHENSFQDLDESEGASAKALLVGSTYKRGSSDIPGGAQEEEVIENIDLSAMENQKDNFYELWHGNHLLSYGLANHGKTNIVDIKYDDLYFDDPANPGGRIESTGFQTIELLVFSSGTSARQGPQIKNPKAIGPDYTSKGIKFGSLRSITYIKVIQGFRLCRSEEKGDLYQIFNRIDVLGIEKIVTFLPRGLGTVTEKFGDTNSEDASVGSAVFSPVILSLRSAGLATHYQITDHITTLEKRGSDKVIKRQAVLWKDEFRNVNGTEVINLNRPTVKGMKVEENNSVRKVEIEISRREVVSESGTTEIRVLKTCSIWTSVVQLVNLRSSTLRMNPSSIMPHEVSSYPLSLVVEVVKPPEESLPRLALFNASLDLLRHGRESKSDNLTNLFGGQWWFVLDRFKLKIVSADPDVSSVADIYNINAVNITLSSDSTLIEMEDFTGVRISTGRVDRSSHVETLYKKQRSSNIFRSKNVVGIGHRANAPPAFLESIWRTVVKDGMVEELRRGMIRLLRKRKIRARLEAERQVAMMMKQLEDKETEAKSKRANQSLTIKEIEERKLVKENCDKLLAPFATMETNRSKSEIYVEVYDELVKTLNEYISSKIIKSADDERYLKSGRFNRLHLGQLIQYLSVVPLPGANGVLDPIVLGILLRGLYSDRNDYASVETFRDWFISDEGSSLKRSLHERNIFALLLDHELRRLEGETDSAGILLDSFKPIAKPSDNVLAIYHLDEVWKDRDYSHRIATEELIRNAFSFVYKGSVRKGTTMQVNPNEGVEFNFRVNKEKKKKKRNSATTSQVTSTDYTKGFMNFIQGVFGSIAAPVPQEKELELTVGMESKEPERIVLTVDDGEDNGSFYDESIEDEEEALPEPERRVSIDSENAEDFFN